MSRSKKMPPPAPAASEVLVDGNVLRREPRSAPAAGAGLDGTTSPQDRRRSPRHAESASGWLSSATGGTITSGRTVAINDLSLHGVGFTSPRPCQVGERFWILITRGHLRLSTRIQVVSTRVRPQGDGWDVGGDFY